MNEVYLYSLGSVGVVSLISFVGVFTLGLSDKFLNRILIYMISFAAGGLLGDAFFHLLPEVVSEVGFTIWVSFYVILGIALSFFVEKVVRWRHCHHVTNADHPHPFALMNLFGDMVHNLIDGLIIGASYLVSIPVGIATTVAVILHEIPQEIGDFGILIHGGFSKGRALFLNFLTALTSVVGVLVALLMASYVEGLTEILIPFAAGGFIYIAIADLIPELHKEVAVSRSILQFLFGALGVALMVGMMFLPFHTHEHDEANGASLHEHEYEVILSE